MHWETGSKFARYNNLEQEEKHATESEWSDDKKILGAQRVNGKDMEG